MSAGLVASQSPEHPAPSQQFRRSASATTASVSNPGHRLFANAMAQEARKRQWAAEEKLKCELRALQLEDCTFTPAITRRAVDLQRPRSLSPQNRIAIEQQQRLLRISEGQQEQIRKELEPCTFHPLILDVAQLTKARAERVHPDIFIALHREAEVRSAWHQKNREAAENAVMQSAGKRAESPKLSKDQLEQVVLRLMKPVGVEEKPDTHNKDGDKNNNNNKRTRSPSIGRLSEAIARMRFTEREESRNVFSRLYGNSNPQQQQEQQQQTQKGDDDNNNENAVDRRHHERVARTMNEHYAQFSHRPSISRESDQLATELRRVTLRQLYSHMYRVLKQQQLQSPPSTSTSMERPPLATVVAASLLLGGRPPAHLAGRASTSPPNSARGGGVASSATSTPRDSNAVQQQQQQPTSSNATPRGAGGVAAAGTASSSVATAQMQQQQRERELQEQQEIDAASLDIVDIARAASICLSMDDARAMMEGLIHSGRSSFTCVQFVESQIAETRRSGPKHFTRKFTTATSSRLDKENLAQQQQQPQQQRLRSISSEVRSRSPHDRDAPRLSREQLNELKEKRLQRVLEERTAKLTKECTFRPKITPHPMHSREVRKNRRHDPHESSVVSSVSTDPEQEERDGGVAVVDGYANRFAQEFFAQPPRHQQAQQQPQEQQPIHSATATATRRHQRPNPRTDLELFEAIFAQATAGRRATVPLEEREQQQQQQQQRRRPSSAGAIPREQPSSRTQQQQQQLNQHQQNQQQQPADLRALGAHLMREQIFIREQRIKEIEQQRAIAAERRRKQREEAERRQREQAAQDTDEFIQRQQQQQQEQQRNDGHDDDEEPQHRPQRGASSKNSSVGLSSSALDDVIRSVDAALEK